MRTPVAGWLARLLCLACLRLCGPPVAYHACLTACGTSCKCNAGDAPENNLTAR